MKISYRWLADHFESPIPSPKEVADLLTFHTCEIEGMTELPSGDTIIEAAVLPNRAPDLLSHAGFAEELRILTGIPLKPATLPITVDPVREIEASVVAPTSHLSRYSLIAADVLSGLSTPSVVSERLNVLGQQSINALVDICNYAMLETGQPMHVFDRDKIVGAISVRLAKEGEELVTLDKKNLSLTAHDLVIADDEGVLALAGVKGGLRGGVTPETKRILVEAGTFNGTMVRKSSQRHGIRTDASQRFENGISPLKVDLGHAFFFHLLDSHGLIATTPNLARFDWYPNKQDARTVDLRTSRLVSVLGLQISADEIESILGRFAFSYTKDGETYHITVPDIRLDLLIEEDLIEEVGRVIGFHTIPPATLPNSSRSYADDQTWAISNVLRDILIGKGFSEVYTYTFTDHHHEDSVVLENPLAKDKPFLRTELGRSLAQSLVVNMQYRDIVGVDHVRIFEIGSVFRGDTEVVSLAIASSYAKDKLESILPFKTKNRYVGEGNVWEFYLDDYREQFLPFLKSEAPAVVLPEMTFVSPALYPTISRDISLFVPHTVSSEEVSLLLKKNAGSLLARPPRLFDSFEKEIDGVKRISYGFRLVFQSPNRTLTNEEIDAQMAIIYAEIAKQDGWQVR